MEQAVYRVCRPVIKSADPATGIIDMLIPMSTGGMDRMDEVILPEAWKATLPEFMKRPVLVSSHDYYDLRKQIGEFMEMKVTDAGLMAKPKYYIGQGNDEADWAFVLASKGMAAYSVGFIPRKWEDAQKQAKGEARRTYTECELMEVSHVVVPANREAIQGLRSKSLNPVISGILDDMAKSEAQAASKPDHNSAKPASQNDMADEIDYLGTLVESIGVRADLKPEAKDLANLLLREAGEMDMDGMMAMMDECETKQGECMGMMAKIKAAMADMNEGKAKGLPGDHMPVADNPVTHEALVDLFRGVAREHIGNLK